jgi:LacI family transcriptional regulator
LLLKTLEPTAERYYGESTDISAVEDKDVSNAMRFIRENKKEPIQVNDVIESVFTSRRCLQKKFRKYFDRTILDEIKNTRIEYAKQLLLDTHYEYLGDFRAYELLRRK